MKKIRFCALILAVISVITLLSSCDLKSGKIAKELEPKKSYHTQYEARPVYQNVTKIPTVSGSYEKARGNLAYFTDTDALTGLTTHTVYNLKTNTVIYTYTDDSAGGVSEIDLVKINGTTLLKVERTDASATHPVWTFLYDENGNSLSSAAVPVETKVNLDLYRFGDSCFIIHADGSEPTFAGMDKAAFPEFDFDYRVAEQYYIEDSDSIRVFDQGLHCFLTVTAPSYAEDGTFIALNDGSVLMQYFSLLPDDAADYDFFVEGSKYELTTRLVDANHDREIKTDYLFVYGEARSKFDGNATDHFANLDSKIENVAYCYHIGTDKRVDHSVKGALVVSLSNKGEVKNVLNCFVEDQGMEMPEDIAPNRFVVADYWESLFLFDEYGSWILDIDDLENYTEDYFFSNGKIFDWTQLNCIYDCVDKRADPVLFTDHVVLMERDGDYFYFTEDGEEVKIDEQHDNRTYMPALSGTAYFVVRVDDPDPTKTEYQYYNSRGALIFSAKAPLTRLSSDLKEDAILFRDSDLLNPTYYRMGE